jgi:hypothetical protein
MRRSWAILIVVALAFTTAVSAGAAKPNCDDDPKHPSCGTVNEDPMAGTECVLWSPDDPYTNLASKDFELTVTVENSRFSEFVCIDVSDVAVGEWNVTVDVRQGSLRELQVIVRDSVAPGDDCARARYRKNKHPDSPFTFTLPVNAADDVNACGIEFAEMVGGVYYATHDTEVSSPLAFLMFVRGSDLVFDVDVDYPNASSGSD